MAISHRLHSSMYARPDEGQNELPKRIVFLSVEGNKTEKDYFNNVHFFREKIGIHSLVHIETLSRLNSDTNSDPEKVYELLTDYMSIREEGILPEEIKSILNGIGKDYPKDKISDYLNNKLSTKESKDIKSALFLAGIDIDYQKYLRDYKGERDDDVFAIIIDRDYKTHSKESLRKIFQRCHENNCLCILTNPCFEFWLLLHVCDVKNRYKNEFEKILENPSVSGKHTFISKKVSEISGHAKHISRSTFEKMYLENIKIAEKRCLDFQITEEGLLNGVGSNMPELFETFRKEI